MRSGKRSHPNNKARLDTHALLFLCLIVSVVCFVFPVIGRLNAAVRRPVDAEAGNVRSKVSDVHSKVSDARPQT